MKKIIVFCFSIFLLLGCFVFSEIKAKSQNESGVSFYSPEKGVYIVDVDSKKCPDCIKPYFSSTLERVEDVGQSTNSFAAINAGFFDLGNMKSISYVVINGKSMANPLDNRHLTENQSQKPYLQAFLNRTEFRVLNCNGQSAFDITSHNTPVSKSCKLVHSVQAGPELVPEFKQSQEAFVVKNGGTVVKESAGALGRYPRSAIAIKDNHVLLIATSKEKPMNLQELAVYIQNNIGPDKAMAFDGGNSTSLYVDDSQNGKFILSSYARSITARRVKSMILISK